jgi:flagellar hook-length control protein FliK
MLVSKKPSENFNNQNFNQEFSNKNSANHETGLKQPDTISLSNTEEKSFKSEIVNIQKETVSENNVKEAGQTAGVDVSKDQIKSFTQIDSIQSSNDSKSLPKINHPVELTKLVEEIKSVIEKGEIKTFELKLTPENLGSVKVVITSTEQIVKASIEVENESVLQAVQTNIDQLKLSLAQSGIQVAAVNVSLAGNDNKAHKSSDSKRKLSEGGSELAVEEKNDERLFKKYGYNTYEYLA